MKFFVAGAGALVILDDGSIRVCEDDKETAALLNREAPDPTFWTSDHVECIKCKASWCEIHRHATTKTECPECHTLLKL